MDNGSINPSEVATLSLLGGGGGIGGYGYGGRGGFGVGTQMLAADAHANGTASDAKLDSLSDNFHTASVNSKFDRLNENISDQEFRSTAAITSLNKDITDSEFRTIDRNRDIERLVVQGQKEAAECCCEAKLLAVQNHATLLAGQAQILANQASDVRVSDAVANAVQNAKLDALLAA